LLFSQDVEIRRCGFLCPFRSALRTPSHRPRARLTRGLRADSPFGSGALGMTVWSTFGERPGGRPPIGQMTVLDELLAWIALTEVEARHGVGPVALCWAA